MTQTLTKRKRGEVMDAKAAHDFWLDCNWFGPKRVCRGSIDFGDQGSVGKHLKRSDLDFYQLEERLDFGVYLGKTRGKYVVGIWNEDCTVLVACEVFESVSEVQHCWQLD